MSFDDAVVALYQAPLEAFVAERKRLSLELKTAGDKSAAARLAKLGRPSISAWAVNQLWWRERAAFEDLVLAAGRVREGEREATSAHREAIARLRGLAAAALAEAGHAQSETTLRRVSMTLSALAAAGGFEPDPPGALAADRDPPGFESLGFGIGSGAESAVSDPSPSPASTPRAPPSAKGHQDAVNKQLADAKHLRDAESAREQAEAVAMQLQTEQRRREARDRAELERRRLESALSAERTELEQLMRRSARLRDELASTEGGAEKSRAKVEDLEALLAELSGTDQAVPQQ